MATLICIMADVSGYNVKYNNIDDKGQSWDSKNLTFLHNFVTLDVPEDKQIFVIHVGVPCSDETFDIINNLNEIQKFEVADKSFGDVNENPKRKCDDSSVDISTASEKGKVLLLKESCDDNEDDIGVAPEKAKTFLLKKSPVDCGDNGRVASEKAKSFLLKKSPGDCGDKGSATSQKVKSALDNCGDSGSAASEKAKSFLLKKSPGDCRDKGSAASQKVKSALDNCGDSGSAASEKAKSFLLKKSPGDCGDKAALDNCGDSGSAASEKAKSVLDDCGDSAAGKKAKSFLFKKACDNVSVSTALKAKSLLDNCGDKVSAGSEKVKSLVLKKACDNFVLNASSEKAISLLDNSGAKESASSKNTKSLFSKEMRYDLVNNIIFSQDASTDMMSSVSLDSVVNQYSSKFQSEEKQVGDTCYAHAFAAIFHLAMKRIARREGGYPDFNNLRDLLIDRFGRDGANPDAVLQYAYPKFRLQYKFLDRDIPRVLCAIIAQRPVLAMFFLTDDEWERFSTFYRNNPSGILSENDIQIDNRPQDAEVSGHAVVLVSYSRTCLKFMNSWGVQFAENGFFCVQDSNVLDVQYYDIFWTWNDLTENEKLHYDHHGHKNAAEFIRNLPSIQRMITKVSEMQ